MMGELGRGVYRGSRLSPPVVFVKVFRIDACRGMQAVDKSLRLGILLQKEAITLAKDEFQGILKRNARVIDLKLVRADEDAFKTGRL